MAAPRRIVDFLELDDARISHEQDDIEIVAEAVPTLSGPEIMQIDDEFVEQDEPLQSTGKKKQPAPNYILGIAAPRKNKKRAATTILEAHKKPKKPKLSNQSSTDGQLLITECNGFVTNEEEVVSPTTQLLLSMSSASRTVYEHAYTVQKISPSRLRPDEKHAQFFDLVTDINTKVIFLTGLPGGGKSAILKIVVAYLIDKLTRGISPTVLDDVKELFPKEKFTARDAALKMVMVTSPTGTAANLIGGITFDSLFAGCDLEKGLFDTISHVPVAVKQKISAARVVIIDELSMIHAVKFANADKIFRLVKEAPKHFFGNCKCIFSGDFFQLKPVYGKHDNISRVTAAARKNDKTVSHPLVFDTTAWLNQEPLIRMVELTRSFRQGESESEFMDLLSAVRTAQLQDSHRELLKSRIMTYEEFCKQIAEENSELVVTPVFQGREYGVNPFNDKQLAKLHGTEYCYAASFVCTNLRDYDLRQYLNSTTNENSGLDKVLNTENIKSYTHYGKAMEKLFVGKANPLNIYAYDGLPSNDKAPIEAYSGYYFDKSMLPITFVLQLAQSGKYLGRANVITRLKVGAEISLTANLDQKHGLSNQARGKVVDFMSIAKFMTYKGTQRLASGCYVSKSSNIVMGILKDDTDPVTDPDDEYEFRIMFGEVNVNGETTNRKVEKFALVKMSSECSMRYLLLTPILTRCDVVSQSRAKKDEDELNTYMKRCLSDNAALTGQPKTMTNLSQPERLALVAQATRRIKVDHETLKGSYIYALHIPACLAWATTIHSVQGDTIQAAWLGECSSNMEDGMFYVFLSRVSKLVRIAWAQDVTKFIKSNQKVLDFYNRKRTQETLRGF